MAPADNRKWQRRETQLASGVCPPVHVFCGRGASFHTGPDLIWAHRENISQKAKATAEGRGPASDPCRQQFQDPLLPETWLSWKFWGRNAQYGLGSLLGAG